MAATNKFATMLHRNTNKIVVILVYAFLEWILILLLLLNSLFSYFITKFAKCFGLKPPCIFCSRLDNVLHQGNSSSNFYSDVVCETHATEISNLGYCSNHQRLAETNSMCESCLASRPNHHRIGFVSLRSHEKYDENGENVDSCSCCNESLNRYLYPSYLLLKPSWEDGNYLGKGSLIVESIEDDDDKEGEGKYIEFEINNGEDHDLDHVHDEEVLDEHQIFSDIESFILREVAEDRSSSVSNLNSDEKDVGKDEKEDDPSGDDEFIHQFVDTPFMQASHLEDRSIEIINMHFENSVAREDDRLIPVKLIDSITCLNLETCKLNEGIEMIQTFVTESLVEPHSNVFEGEVLLTMNENAEKRNMRELEESLENSITLEVEGLNQNSAVQTSMNDDNSIEEAENAQVDLFRSQEPICSYECTQDDESESSDDDDDDDDDDDEAENAFEKFISQNNLRMSHSLSNDEKSLEADIEEEQENTPPDDLPPSEELTCSNQFIPEDQSSTSEDDTEVPNAFDDFIAQNNIYTDKTGVNDDEMAEKTVSVEKVEEETSHQSSKFSESCEVEESMDGSVASEVEYGDPVLTIDRLKKAVKAEQIALSAIYQELEEERSASAIATNQTMAMITRLQEEKAAMQMEALQYQRMMEEQAEYDQEALQILNDLITKREKEKQELEKEVEEYREKVMDYEAKEKLRLLRRMKDGSVKSRDSCSCCNTGFTDELSVDLNNEEKEENVETVSNLEEIALDCVKHVSELDSTLEEFEEEKASILDQLKALEEKIISLEDGEEYLDDKEDYSNGISYDKNSPRKTIGCLAKKLLPYLDEVDNENDEEAFAFDRELESESNEMQKSVPIMSQMDSMKVCVEEEVDRVYERLQALETDREFLQHCMGSIQNGGDEGKDLLQEILQHLRDLKNVELRLKNLDNDPSTIVELHSPCKDL
ncbi:myosin-binding protein 3-like [Vicia villosa]|uniref:myosin-binding protein 3-like n=1 Tax=Vicia villosa TaxID=3911 RepID=UPI00273BB215|nr:myosin-binding protein 3-like [Vicia villosa]